MQKQSTDRLSMRNVCAVMIVVHISNSIVLGFPTGVGTDSWIAYLCAALVVVPLMMLYGRLVHLMPGKDLFGMMEFVFGKWACIVLSALFAFYFISLSSVVRNYYAEFVREVALVHTPLLVVLFAFFAVCIYLAKSGTETMGKWSTLVLLLSVFITVFLVVMAIPKYDVDHLLPLLIHSPGEIAVASLNFIPMPIGETVIVLAMMNGLEKKVNPYKAFVFSGLFTILFFVAMYLRNCAILGEKMMETVNFSSYKAASVIHIGSVETRIESLVATLFIATGITKVACSLYAGAKAVSSTLRMTDHNPILLSIGFFSVGLSTIIFYNMVEMFDFTEVYRFIALPFQVAIPLAIWVTAEVKMRRNKIPIQKCWKQPEEEPATQS